MNEDFMTFVIPHVHPDDPAAAFQPQSLQVHES